MYNTLIFSQKRETTSFKHLWVDILIFPDFFKLFNSFQLGATSIARIGEVWLSDELWGGLRLCSKIPNFSLLEYIALPTQRVQDCLTKTNPCHRHWQEQHEPWHKNCISSTSSRWRIRSRLATIHYSSTMTRKRHLWQRIMDRGTLLQYRLFKKNITIILG